MHEEVRPNILPILLLLLAAALALSVLYLDNSNGEAIESVHGYLKHGGDYMMVKECMKDPRNVMGIWQNSANGRSATVCQITDNLFGIRISDSEGEITAFVKNKFKTIEQVVRYLENCGYIK